MIKLIIISLFSMFALQNPEVPMVQSDPKAKVILDKTSATFKQLKNLKADLEISIESPDQSPFLQKAVVYIEGQNFRLELPDEVIICDNKSIWRYLKDMNEVQISDYEPGDDEITPTNIFNIYENDFYYQYAEEVTENGKKYHAVDLTPFDKEKSYFKVRVWVSAADNFIHKMKVFDKNGTRYTYSIANLSKDTILKTTTFQFNKADYPNIHIEDLRF
ncbi:MAG: outer membrane lipoprotein carrier protein LolA [Chitinophagales bacterium]